MSTRAPRSAAVVHSVGSTRAARRSPPRSTALRRSAPTRLASRSRQSDKSRPRRSQPARTANVRSTSISVTGRSRLSVKSDPSRLQWRNTLCHNDARRKVQLRKADPRFSDSARSTPLKSHSVNTTRSVRNRFRSSSRKSWPTNSRSVQTVSVPSTPSAGQRCEVHQRVFADLDQGSGGGVAVAGVDGNHRDVLRQRQRLAHLVRRMPWGAIELVDGDQEGQVAGLEEIHRGEAVLKPPAVDEDDRPDGAADQVVPHEPESPLTRCAEEVERQLFVQ